MPDLLDTAPSYAAMKTKETAYITEKDANPGSALSKQLFEQLLDLVDDCCEETGNDF